MKKTIEIQLDEQKITISKLPLGKYSELLKSLQELPKHIPGLAGKKTDEILKELPSLIAVALPDFVSILAIATPLTKEEISQLGLDETVKIVKAIVEVNNYGEVYEYLKKALARPNRKSTSETGSTGQ